MNIEQAVVVITGAGSGIGLATALRFAKAKARLHLSDVRLDAAERAAAECSRLGANATAYSVDCRDAKATQKFCDDVVARDGRVDVWHNNAGVAFSGRVQEMTLDDWHFVLDTNLWGVVHGTHAVLPVMLKQKSGHIINTASVLGLYALPSAAAYCASKHAVVALSDSLGAEVAGSGVKVTAICPGLVATRIMADGRIVEGRRSRGFLEKFWATAGVAPDRVARDVIATVKKDRTGTRISAGSLTALSWLRTLTPSVYRLTLRGFARRS